MPRPRRTFEPGGLYHVTTRGNDRRPAFRSDADRVAFLERLAAVVGRYELRCHSYCLLTTHYHLLLESGAAGLAPAMQLLNGGHARAFNRRHARHDHLFGRRYGAVHITTDAHLLETHRYIALNPVRARLASRAEEWPWSSYPALAGWTPAPPLLATDAVLELCGRTGDRALAQLSFRAFVEAAAEGACEPIAA